MCAILALAEKKYRRSAAVLQHKLKSERQIRAIPQTRAGGQDGWNRREKNKKKNHANIQPS